MFLLTALFALTAGVCEAHQEIQSIYSIHEVDFKKCEGETLVVFDVDEVLITSQDHFFKPAAEDFLFSLIKEEVKAKRAGLDEKLSISLIEAERVIVEEAFIEFIQSLKTQGIKVLALTSFPTGKFGLIDQLERWRFNNLASFGFYFHDSFNIPRMEFKEIAKPNIAPPIFQDGILYSRGYLKGEVLLAFLDKIDWTPVQVICFDDLLENLHSIKSSLNDRAIEFTGYHYRKAELSQEEIDFEKIRLQFQHLMEHGEFLKS